jgi:hypothetical protein
MKKLVIAIIAIFAIALSTAFAGGWGHGQYSPGQFSAQVSVPAAAQVQQVYQAFMYNGQYGEVVNDGPLGSYNAMVGPEHYLQGSTGPGVYYIYQVVLVSGYSVTAITW